MNKKCFLVLLLSTVYWFGHAQTEPQYEFNQQLDLRDLQSGDHLGYDAFLRIEELYSMANNNKEKLMLLQRWYEVAYTRVILYAKNDTLPLPFRTENDYSDNAIPVDFGANLLLNQWQEEGFFVMFFDSPVTKIDPAIFAPGVTAVFLPASANLSYTSSPSICVPDLKYLEGHDVINNTALVISDGTLIVAATASFFPICIVPESVTRIGEGAFRGSPVMHVFLSKSVKRIDAAAFDLCKELKSVVLNSPTLVQIADGAFSSDKRLKYKIEVPKYLYKDYCERYPSLKKRFKPQR